MILDLGYIDISSEKEKEFKYGWVGAGILGFQTGHHNRWFLGLEVQWDSDSELWIGLDLLWMHFEIKKGKK